MAEKLFFNIQKGFKYSIGISVPLLGGLFLLIGNCPSEFKSNQYFWITFGLLIILAVVILFIGIGGWLYAMLKGIFRGPLHEGCLGKLIYNNDENNYKCKKCHQIISHPK